MSNKSLARWQRLGRTLLLALAGFMFGALWTTPVHASAEYSLQTGVSWYRFSNPFQYPDGVSSPLNTNGSAWSDDLRGALFLPLPTERSSLQVTGMVSQMRYNAPYNNYTDQLSTSGSYNLDRPIKQIEATYNWEFSDLLRGSVTHRIDDRLFSYLGGEIVPNIDSVPPNVSNVEPEYPHIREDTVEVAYRVNNHLDLPLTWVEQTLSYTLPGRAELLNMNSNALQAAVRYNASTNSNFQFGVRRNKVNFPGRTASDISQYDSGYTDTEYFSDIDWLVTSDTLLKVHFGRVSRQFDTLTANNSTLPSTEVGMIWNFSPKTTFITRLWHHPQPNDEADNFLYVMSRGTETIATWQPTPKTRLSATASVELDSTQGFPGSNAGNVLTNGTDRTKRLSLRYDYNMTRNLNLRIDATREVTDTNPGTPATYHGNMLRISLSYSFDNLGGTVDRTNPLGFNRAHQQIETMRSE
ncbi:hypothetical protein FHW67_000329 [Herbaspirillum sp. Sphag1AN]|uniref:hypothetical protein n=1 Tax=unclassified Herbaspirillum TaxID=2624150 RepID=UPI0016091E51|nr:MULTISPECIES: hypothetical protein [unclassified Herbaspirillum]MBB3211094.1 hypothetical protein [Herbaspirillum sp. Sphag1AN]MBB3244723.1 hypothetical protein [Herbaspirillum sp. Sphag64]